MRLQRHAAIFAVRPAVAPPPGGASSPGKPSDDDAPPPSSVQWEAPGSQRARYGTMASPRTVTIVALSFALGLFFVFMGTIKLTPRLSKDAYSEMKRAYKSYAKALPGLKKIGISSVLLRKIIGSLEVGCGVVLTLVPGRPKDVANFLLLLVMLAVLFFHQLVGDPLKRYAHALVFGILLTCRLLIARQSDERPEREDGREEQQHMNDQEKNKVKQS
ncbi:putative transmembrane protein 35 [Scophthalmus maximus]|uniref:Novel acetylcholine receptor chaperone n=2 Tax=Scophthalmus maximus TaxID=52904 RepID=A0A2U9C713_SCOMX|nr:putative transmembrane protein 35 [Scophthalmus maximus]KAF0039912.1 hypothetical protein F2P81_008147 [Scophthalmus maximus]